MKLLFNISLMCALLFAACQSTKDTGKTEDQDASSAVTGDNSRTALDWPGTYTGMLPCADCEGIETALTLKADLTYVLKTLYKGKSAEVITQNGSFEWDAAGSKIQLKEVQPGSYLVGEGRLFQLDQAGNQISGALAERYILRQSVPALIEKYWKLVALEEQAVVYDENMRKEAHLIFKNDGKVYGSTGCNQMSGGYESPESGKLTFKPMAATRMLCMENKVEQPFMDALEKVKAYALNNDTLRLFDATSAELARFEVVYLR